MSNAIASPVPRRKFCLNDMRELAMLLDAYKDESGDPDLIRRAEWQVRQDMQVRRRCGKNDNQKLIQRL